MSYNVITAPAVEPVSVSEFKLHARIDGTAEDSILPIYIAAARQECEQRTQRSLISQTVERVLDDWPEYDDIELQYGPVSSVAAIYYLDSNGDQQIASSSLYTLDSKSDPAWVVLQPDAAWPEAGDYANAVTVRYAAGYGAAGTDVPSALRAWILLAATWLYEHRTSPDGAKIPNGFADGLLDRFTTWRV